MQTLGLLLSLYILSGSFCNGQIAGMEDKAPVIKEAVPLIQCQVCQNLMRQAYRTVNTLREEQKPGKMKELDVMESLEQICDPDSDKGNWIAKTDLQVIDNQLKLVDMDQVGDCRSECRTVARTCSDLMEDIDMDLAENLFKGLKRAAITSKMCYSETNACNRKVPPVPQDWVHNEEFKVLDEKEVEMRKMMKQMQDMGMGGQMFNREDLMNKMDPLGAQVGEPKDPPSKTPAGATHLSSASVMQKGVELGKAAYSQLSDAVGTITAKFQNLFRKREEL